MTFTQNSAQHCFTRPFVRPFGNEKYMRTLSECETYCVPFRVPFQEGENVARPLARPFKEEKKLRALS